MVVLLAEDERDLAVLMIDYLESEGIDCDYACDGSHALQLIQQNTYDALILDINMPGTDGLSVCQMMRQQCNPTSVIFVTARDALDDKLEGFASGAQDYLTKPFAMAELVARLYALQSQRSLSQRLFQLSDLSLNFTTLEASRAGRGLALTASQWQVLEQLASSSPAPVSRQVLEQCLWPDQDVAKGRLKMVMSRLRQLINANPPALLHTIVGQGFCLRDISHD